MGGILGAWLISFGTVFLPYFLNSLLNAEVSNEYYISETLVIIILSTIFTIIGIAFLVYGRLNVVKNGWNYQQYLATSLQGAVAMTLTCVKSLFAYVSIDLDVLEPESNGFELLVTEISEMLIDSLCKSICQICSVFDVVAGDICGIVVTSECSEEELDRGVKLILKALGVLIELCKAK